MAETRKRHVAKLCRFEECCPSGIACFFDVTVSARTVQYNGTVLSEQGIVQGARTFCWFLISQQYYPRNSASFLQLPG